MNLFKSKYFSFFFLALAGLIFLGFLFKEQKTMKIIGDGNSIETTKFAVHVFDSSKKSIFSISPLNDYLYIGDEKAHVEEELISSDNGTLLDEFLISSNNLFLIKKSLMWNTNGINSFGNAEAEYKFEELENGIKISRRVRVNGKIDKIGQVYKYCSGCIIADDKNRAFFNGDTISNTKTLLASKLNLTVFALEENEFFLPGIKKIYIIGSDGVTRAEINVGNSEVFLQEKWNLLEFKASSNGEDFINQTVDIKI